MLHRQHQSRQENPMYLAVSPYQHDVPLVLSVAHCRGQPTRYMWSHDADQHSGNLQV